MKPDSNDTWLAQLRRRLRSPEELAAYLGDRALPSGAAVAGACEAWPMAVTPYYASLIRRCASSDPIRRLCAADPAELSGGDLDPDPFDEAGHMPVSGLIRRYRDRAALIATRECAVLCRHCTRRNELRSLNTKHRKAGGGANSRNPTPNNQHPTANSQEATADGRAAVAGASGSGRSLKLETWSLELPPVLAWLRRHPEVREILVTGGDPLVLSTARLDAILRALRSVPTIEILRIGTRVPVVLPQRITRGLCAMLRRHHPVWLNTHFNHPAELTPEAARACERLADAGIPVGNQAVLLRGVNDSVDTLEALFRGLVRMRVRPYYLLQCDPVRGTAHFRVPLRRALGIVDELRARLTGLAVPTFVVDTPGTAGKIPLLPTAVVRWTRTGAILRGPRGRRVEYREPAASSKPWKRVR